MDQWKQQIETLTAVVQAMPDESPEKEALTKRAQSAEASLLQFGTIDNEIAQLENELANADAMAVQLTKEIEELKASSPPTLAENVDLAQLKLVQSEIQAEMTRLRTDSNQVDSNIAEADQRRDRMEKELVTIESQLESAAAAIEQAKSLGDSTVDRLTMLEASLNQFRLSQRQSFLLLRQRVATVSQQLDLDQKRQDWFALKLAERQASAKQIEDAIADLRQMEADNIAAEATEKAKDVRDKFPMLSTGEEANVVITNDIRELEEESAKITNQNRELTQRLTDIAETYTDTRTRIKAIGRSSTVGAMLRKRKSELPNALERQQQAALARNRIEEIQFERFQISELLSDLSPAELQREIEEAGVEINPEDWSNLQEPVEQLIARRQEALRSKDKILERLFRNYLDIETKNSRVAKIVDQFDSYINERILWLRSNRVLLTELELDRADQALISPSKWTQIAGPASRSIQKRPFLFGFGGLMIVVLLAFRPKMRTRVDSFGAVAGRGDCVSFWPTGRAAILTILIAISIPLLVFGIGWAFQQLAPSGSLLFDAMAKALSTAGLFAIPVEILRRVCRPNGLATKHFDWSDEAVGKLKRNLTWYVVPATVLVFVISLLIGLDAAHRVDLIERCLFIAAMLITAWMLFSVFSPADGIFSQYLNRHENSWANQMSSIWFTLILLLPVSLAILAFAGYYYTALNLTQCLCFSFAFAVGIELIRALVRRFVLIRRRAAHIESARRKRQAEIDSEREARKKAAAERQRRIEAGEDLEDMTTPVMTSESLAELQFESIDIDENAGQANQLIRLLGWTAWLIGLWVVWSDVLPAMKALDEYKLWSQSTPIASAPAESELDAIATLPSSGTPIDATPNGSSDSSTATTGQSDGGDPSAIELAATDVVESPRSPLFVLDPPEDDGVSLRDFLVFLAIVLLTFFAARNLPNSFEMLFLEELPVDRSARYASKALFSYAIVIVGTLLAMRTLSINWTSVQWLVTALTFGLAFGLQEIFANFVAGIILMFERPMRIGDLITVDEFTGVVARIRTRATTVVNWDRKEYVIPNKDFITGRLINWTLSDAINRIQFTVGIAYGSDVVKAKKIIFDICNDHPSIVDEPPTSITFEAFADSSLNLGVRTFLGEVDSRLPVIDSLHLRINAAFNEAGIEIAFPQRDLNLRTVDDRITDAISGNGSDAGKAKSSKRKSN